MDYGKLALKKVEELYDEVYGLRKGFAQQEGSVSTSTTGNGKSVYEEELVFFATAGSVTVSVFINPSANCVAEVLLDNESLGKFTFYTGGNVKDVVCEDVSAGHHTMLVKVSGEEVFNLNGLKLTVTGSVTATYSEYYIEGFYGCDDFIKVGLNRLELYTCTDVNIARRSKFFGIKTARTAYGNGKFVVAVTENGKACLLDFTNSYVSPEYLKLSDNATCACGVCMGEGVAIFVGDSEGVEGFFYYTQTGEIEKRGRVKILADDVLALCDGNKIFLISSKGGYLSFNEEAPTQKLSTIDTFNLLVTKEI